MQTSTYLSLLLTVFSICGVSYGAKSPRVFSESYIEGVYGRFFEFSDEGNSAPCPQVIDHYNRGRPGALGDSWIIPHGNIVQSGAQCRDGGVLVLSSFNESSQMPKVLESNRIAEETFTLMKEESTGFWMGADERKCGKWIFPSRTYIFFVKEFDRTLTTSFRLTLSPGKKYMFVVADQFTCIYVDIPRKRPDSQVTIATPGESAPSASTGPSVGDGSTTEKEPSGSPSPTENVVEAGDDTSDGSQASGDSDSGANETNEESSDPSGGLSIVDVDNGQVPEETEEVIGGTIADIDTDDSDEESAEETSDSFGIEVNNGESLCFPGDAHVEMMDGTFKPMEKLTIGDEVRVGRHFSRVFMFTHKQSNSFHRFVQFETMSGRKLALTSGHMLYVNGVIKAAKEVRVGDRLSQVHEADQVIKVSTVIKRGLFNPQTVHGDIVVNGLLTSTYTTAIDRQTAHSMLLPLRAIWNIFGLNVIPSSVDWSGIRSNLITIFNNVAMYKQ
ncbi:hypothetical protein FGB62_34g18 [Gracilaria domingensis]|nr:hypothetical protein FGB62_34g18 [Gracilaria domingensis]